MKKLHLWFSESKRDFPWRNNPEPYQVWVSEIMLQQTRASVVIPYFQKWMELFPSVEVLANSPLEEVIKVWEGLGYYSRARNLHKGARFIVDQFGGKIPSEREDLEKIPGIGPYTVGAILSFAFHKRAIALDGNVGRVLSRYFLIEENISKQRGKRTLAEKGESILDKKAPWITAEALIELGASLCSPKPRCEGCPLQDGCLAFKYGRAESLPIKNGAKEIIPLRRAVVLLTVDGKILVKKGEKGKVMADLYEFPYFEMDKEIWGMRKIVTQVQNNFSLKVSSSEKLPSVSHSFTRYQCTLFPLRCYVEEPKSIEGFEWVLEKELNKLPFSSGHRRLIRGSLL